METIGLVLLVAYGIGSLHLFPKGRNSLDIFKLNPVLLPFWWKFIGLGCLVSIIAHSIIEGNINPFSNDFLLAGMYFGLLQIAFSKEKSEDEYSAQIRIKAMYVSIISLFLFVGMFSSFVISVPGSIQDFPYQLVMMMFISSLIVYLAYFYWTIYGAKRGLNEE